VIASAVVPTLIANAIFFPKHLLEPVPMADEEDELPNGNGDSLERGEQDGAGPKAGEAVENDDAKAGT
jgi:hypothetical protein